MKRMHVGRVAKDVLLVLALVTLVVQLFAFSNVGQVVAKQVQDVLITNTDAQPVPVQMTNNTVKLEPREAFQRSINNIPGQAGAEFVNFSISVPDGKRLVIESASVHVTVPAGQHVSARLSANGPPGTIFGSQHLVLAKQGTFGGNDVFTANHSMLLWAGPGQNNVSISVRRSESTGTIVVEAAVVGYLEDL